METLFDRVFIVVGVVFQLNTDVQCDPSNILGQVIENAPALVPALWGLLSRKTSLVTLAMMQDELDKEKRNTSAQKIQTAFRGFYERRHSGLELKRLRAELCTLQLQPQQEPEWQCACTRFAASNMWEATVGALGIVYFVLGIVLWWYVSSAIESQEQACVAQIGGIARCLWPRIYFNGSGIFGATGCHFPFVEGANCSFDHHHLEVELPEAPVAFHSMRRLTRINVSNNPTLRSVPESWGLIPTLENLDVSGSRQFARLPYRVCAMRSLTALDISGTAAQRVLNWSGQIRVANVSQRLGVSKACVIALKDTLTHLDLSSNSFRLPCKNITIIPQGRGARTVTECNVNQLRSLIEPLAKLEWLSLESNLVDTLSPGFFALTRHVGSLLLAGNRIRDCRMVSEAGDRVLKIVRTLRSNPYSALLNTLQIDASATLTTLENAFSGFTGLTFLQITSHRVSLLNRSTFEGLSNLQRLDLRHGLISKVEPETFSPLVSLRTLLLEQNKLRRVPDVGGLTSLWKLALHHNEIERLDAGAFSSLTALDGLSLDSNEFTRIQNDTFNGLTELHTLPLYNNPLTHIEPGSFAPLVRLDRLAVLGGGAQRLGVSSTTPNVTLNQTFHAWGVRAGLLPHVDCAVSDLWNGMWIC